MLSKNIFEQDPFISKDLTILSTLNPSIVEPSFEHVCHVYQALIQFMIFFPEKCQIDHVKNIIRLLNIPDNKERENLMTLHQDYVSAHMNQKEGIYRLLQTELANVLCGIYAPYCVKPVLSFLKMIVRKEHLASILYTHLLPLYCHEKLYLYSNKLTNLVVKISKTGKQII